MEHDTAGIPAGAKGGHHRARPGAGIQALAREFGERVLAGAGKALGLGLFPGALSPTEILEAWNAGADAVKVFPAGSLGPGYVKAVRAPLSHVPMLAVGGVNEANAGDFIRAGCVGVGVGGNLVNRQWIENGEWDRITELARAYVRAVREA